jgi:hypothetical protein
MSSSFPDHEADMGRARQNGNLSRPPRKLAVVVREHDGSVTPHTLYLQSDGERPFDFVYTTPRHHAVDGVDSITLLIPKEICD